MSTYPEALAAHLAGSVTTVCHCWRLTRRDGVVTGFTDHDRALVVDGTTFEPESGFSASEARDRSAWRTDTVDIEGALSSLHISEEDIAAGRYDGATVETLLVNWREPSQFALLRTATIGKITQSDQRFVAELESLTQALDQPAGSLHAPNLRRRAGRPALRVCDLTAGISGQRVRGFGRRR